MSQRLPIINARHSLAVDSEVVGILCLANNSGFNVEQVLHSTKTSGLREKLTVALDLQLLTAGGGRQSVLNASGGCRIVECILVAYSWHLIRWSADLNAYKNAYKLRGAHSQSAENISMIHT